MKNWQIETVALKARQLLTLMLATLMCVSVAVSPAQATGQLNSISESLSGLTMDGTENLQIALADSNPNTTPTLLGS